MYNWVYVSEPVLGDSKYYNRTNAQRIMPLTGDIAFQVWCSEVGSAPPENLSKIQIVGCFSKSILQVRSPSVFLMNVQV